MRRREFLGALAAAAAPWPALGQPQRSASMRPFYQDITGTTDSSGNATIRVKLPTTGEWHNLKFAIGTTGPTEWAVNINGRPYTFGRGRRVTLGPELILDGQSLTISATGGPVNANIDGTATGTSGSPAEILSTFTPAPNTIALDSSQQNVPLVAPRVVGNGAFFSLPPLPTGTLYLSVFYQPSTGTSVKIIGTTLSPAITYYSETVPASASGFLRYVKVDPSIDPLLQFNNNGPGTINNLEIIAHADTHPPLDLQGNVLVDIAETSANPAPWQAAKTSTAFGIAPAGLNTDFTVIPAVAGQTIYLHDLNVVMNAGANYEFALWDGPSANGLQVVELAQIFVTAAGVVPNLRWDGRGRPLTVGNALIGTQISGPGGLKFFGTLGYSQQ